jgi:hypothetical protein
VRMKHIKDMEHDTTYLLCPDKACTLFTKPNCPIPCERECPHQDKLIKIIKCGCGELVELPGDHSSLRRVDHPHKDGSIGWSFQRISGKYERIFEMPVKEG